MRAREFLGCSNCLEKSQRRSEVELGYCMAGQVLVFGVCKHARQLVACG